MTGDNFDLGAYMKKFRSQRHISLRAASPERASTLSRFENGKTRMGGNLLREVMQHEGLRYWDIQQHSARFLSPFKQLIDQLYVERFNLQSGRVISEVSRYRKRVLRESGKLVDMIENVIDAMLEQPLHGHQTRLKSEIQHQIQELLFASRDWVIFDYNLAWLAAPYLDSSVLIRLIRRAAVQRSEALPAYYGYFARVFERISLELLSRHAPNAVTVCAPFLSLDALDAFDGEDNFTFEFLQVCLSDVDGVAKQARFLEIHEALELLELKVMQSYFDQLAQTILSEVEGE